MLLRKIATIFPLLAGVCAAADGSSKTAQFRLFLPANVPSEQITFSYMLYGNFGAHGGSATPRPNAQFIEVPFEVEGKPASAMKAYAWVPGCRIATFKIKVEAVNIQDSYQCEPLGTVSLKGRIKESGMFRGRSAELRVDYSADWTCDFFGLADCIAPQISLGVFRLDREGRFEIELPDFANDPISSGSKIPSSFQLVLREVKTWNLISFVDPELDDLRTAGGGLKPSSTYPEPVIFVARRVK